MVIDWVMDYIIKEWINMIYYLIAYKNATYTGLLCISTWTVCHVEKFKQLRYLTVENQKCS